MTLPTSDAQSSRLLPRRPQMIPPTHSMPTSLPPTSLPSTPLSPGSAAGANKTAHEHALDFATHSWDLATGGLKTLTAKRELPTRPDRRSAETLPDATSRSYIYALIILSCVLLMLIGGGVVLFVMLQP